MIILSIFLSFLSLTHADIQRFQMLEAGLYRGDQPDEISDYQLLADMGVRTIVNLRNDNTVRREVQLAKKVGIDVVSIPMSTFTVPSSDKVWRILDTISDPDLQPVYLHCQYGKDRTGFISALYRVHFQKWKKREARDEMLEMGFSTFLSNFLGYYYVSTYSLP